jgi:hypothetical protein
MNAALAVDFRVVSRHAGDVDKLWGSSGGRVEA